MFNVNFVSISEKKKTAKQYKCCLKKGNKYKFHIKEFPYQGLLNLPPTPSSKSDNTQHGRFQDANLPI